MSMSDYYGSWVERHTLEDEECGFWRTENDVPVDGPYTEEELNKVLWDAVVAGDATPGAP